jgi:hypothetical protein
MKQDMTRMSWAALALFAVAFVVLAGGYHIGKDLAERDTPQGAN